MPGQKRTASENTTRSDFVQSRMVEKASRLNLCSESLKKRPESQRLFDFFSHINEKKEMKHKHVSRLPVFAATLQLLASRFSSLRELFLIFVMSLAVVGIYWPPPAEPDVVQMGLDYWQLHSRRMAFAREGLSGPARVLPAWYPRELLGTPFWSNIQNFPFIPTRLMVLLTMDPAGPYTYATAVIVSAVLAALFTYLYLRKVGVGVTGAAAAGWTFACSGYYASRIAAGICHCSKHIQPYRCYYGSSSL